MKQKLDIGAVLTTEQANALLRQFSFELLPGAPDALTKLYGGYSGSNYRARCGDGREVLLKLLHDTNEDEVTVQVEALRHMRRAGFLRTAFPQPVAPQARGAAPPAASSSFWVSAAPSHGAGSFALVLDFLRGAPVDGLLARWEQAAAAADQGGRGQGQEEGGGGTRARIAATAATLAVFRQVGGLLASLHAVPLPLPTDPPSSGPAAFRTATGGGACTCTAEIGRELLCGGGALAQDTAVAADPFVALLRERLPALQRLADGAELPRSLLHGDPFMDNILALEAEVTRGDDGAAAAAAGTDAPARVELQGIVDWEDVCAGPRLFDVACAAIGGCFLPPGSATERHCLGIARSGSGGCLDLGRLEALLSGYQQEARPPLCRAEREALVPAMQGALLCNAFFRFRKFRCGKTPAATAAGTDGAAPALSEAHVELVERMLALDDGEAQAAVAAAVERAVLLPGTASPE